MRTHYFDKYHGTLIARKAMAAESMAGKSVEPLCSKYCVHCVRKPDFPEFESLLRSQVLFLHN